MRNASLHFASAILLSAAAIALPALTACESPPCDSRTTVYDRMMAPIALAAVRPVQLPITLIAPAMPSTVVIMTFQLVGGCGATPPSGGSLGSFRLLAEDGTPIDTTTSLMQSINTWCGPDADASSRTGSQIPARLFHCDATHCSASLLLEIVPSQPLTTMEIEAQLRDTATACSGVAPTSPAFRAHLEQFGP